MYTHTQQCLGTWKLYETMKVGEDVERGWIYKKKIVLVKKLQGNLIIILHFYNIMVMFKKNSVHFTIKDK